METLTLMPLIVASVWPEPFVVELVLTAYGWPTGVAVTAPSGPLQLLNFSFEFVPTFSGALPVFLPLLTVVDAVEAFVDPLVEQVTLMPLSDSTVLEADRRLSLHR